LNVDVPSLAGAFDFFDEKRKSPPETRRSNRIALVP
jgi:hypothetical protein